MAIYKRQRYLFMTLDPVHIGTGGYRLGRVDNSIVREPGTKIPKIPGTSLHGAARSYAARLYGTPTAAGQSHDKIETPDENPVCYTFGYIQNSQSSDNNSKMYSGVVNIFDAHIVLFPVYSMVGPVWVSTVERLEDAGFTVNSRPSDLKTNQALMNWTRTEPLNLGWLMVGCAGEVTVNPPNDSKWECEKRYQAISKIVIVKDTLFSQIVNSNLEVRTSVAINPVTGAANDGALFTYEAIPRATFLTTEVVLDDYRAGQEKVQNNQVDNEDPKKCQSSFPQNSSENIPGGSWECPLCVVKAGFRMIEWLGVGGMGTRGFGRMAMVGEPINIELETLFSQEESNG